MFTNEAPLIKYGLAEGFRQAGHTVKVIQGETERLWGQPLDEQKRRLTTALKDFRPDIIFTEGHPGFEVITVCETIKKHSIPHFYWAIEDPVSTEQLSVHYARYADYVFTTTRECIPRYKSMRKPAETLLFGCNPELHRFTGIQREYQHDIVLVASNYSSRYKEAGWLVMPLVKKNYNIKVWGLWWDDTKRPVNLHSHPNVYGGLLPYEELAKVYSSAKITLGMNCDDSSITQTSMRPYEALACGGSLYLGHYTKAQKAIFGEHIYQAHNTEETLTLVNKLLTMPEKEHREKALTAQKYVYENHNYQLRAEQIIAAYRKI
ncbi:MAG: glycosyltransferase [Acidobacteriota bacterium]